MARSNYLILSFDGGGLRGLIPALLVEQLDQKLDFLKHVDLFAGTSTGGLLALALASGVSVSSIVDIYMTKGGDVFDPYEPLGIVPAPELLAIYPDAALLPSGLLYVKYLPDGLKKLVMEKLPDAGKPLNQLGRDVLVTTFDLYQTDKKPWGPVSLTNLPNHDTGDITVLDAALSTTAGPVYFPPHFFEYRGEKKAFIDGGVYANNPSMLAVATVMASGVLKEDDLAFENIKLFSLGTGLPLSNIPPGNHWRPELHGVLRWMFPKTQRPTPQLPLLELLMDGVSSINTFQCERILGNNFRRGNVELTELVNPDDLTIIRELKEKTEAYMDSDEWKEIKDWIRREFVP